MASYGDAVAMGRVLTEVSTPFRVSTHDLMGVIGQSIENKQPVHLSDRVQQHVAAVAAPAAVGVHHIAYLSFLSAAADATFILSRDHFHPEEYIRATRVAFTVLRVPTLWLP